MFGLMQKTACSPDNKLHYCGTCKSMGSAYSQGARALLNHDTVFLSELLSALQTDSGADWDPAFHKDNCFSLPKEIPLSMHYAGTINLIFSALKADDQLRDGAGILWKGVNSFYKKDFKNAFEQLETWGIPTEPIWEDIEDQQIREKESGKSVDFYAAPTGRLTASLMQAGACLLDLPVSLEAFGAAFGSLLYLLDAFEDYEDDLDSGDFNALQAAGVSKEEALQLIDAQEALALECLNALPIPAEQQAGFAGRLRLNLSARVYAAKEMPAKVKIPRTIAQRWRWAQNYSLSTLIFVVPRTSEYLPMPEQGYTKSTIITAFFAGLITTLGLMPKGLRRKLIRRLRKQSKDCCDTCNTCTECCTDCADQCERCLNLIMILMIVSAAILVLALIIILIVVLV